MLESFVELLIENTRQKLDKDGRYIFFGDRVPNVFEKVLRFVFPKDITHSGKVIDIWFKKYQLYPDQGLRERHNFYLNQYEKGKITPKSEDWDCIERSVKRYGRERVDVGYHDPKVRQHNKR